MSKQLDLFDQSKKQWVEESKSAPTRNYSFDTISGESIDPLYFPKNPTATKNHSRKFAVFAPN